MTHTHKHTHILYAHTQTHTNLDNSAFSPHGRVSLECSENAPTFPHKRARTLDAVIDFILFFWRAPLTRALFADALDAIYCVLLMLAEQNARK